MKSEFYHNESKLPQKLFYKMKYVHQKRCTFFNGENKYGSSIRDREGDEVFTTIYQPARIKKHDLIKDVEQKGDIFGR